MGFQKNPIQSQLFYCFLLIKRIIKVLFSFIPWLLNFSDFPTYGSNLRKRYTLRLLSKCLGRSTPRIVILTNRNAPPSTFSSIPLVGLLCVLAKLLQNGAKLIQKLTPGFKNHMRVLDNFKKAVESPKSWNSMGYFCPKTTFLQLMQRIYLTLLSIICGKIHQIPYVLFEAISHYSRHKSSVIFGIRSQFFFKLCFTLHCHET